MILLSLKLWGFYKRQILPHLFFILSNCLDRYKLLKIFYRIILMLIASFSEFSRNSRNAVKNFPLLDFE